MLKYLEVVEKYNRWFPKKGTLDLESWEKVKCNIEKRRGAAVPPSFWCMWALISIAVSLVNEQLIFSPKEFSEEVQRTLHEFKLNADTLAKAKMESAATGVLSLNDIDLLGPEGNKENEVPIAIMVPDSMAEKLQGISEEEILEALEEAFSESHQTEITSSKEEGATALSSSLA